MEVSNPQHRCLQLSAASKKNAVSFISRLFTHPEEGGSETGYQVVNGGHVLTQL